MNTGQRPTRRDFLQGRAAAEALASAMISRQTVSTQTVVPGSGTAPAETHLLTSLRRRAMACEFEVQLATARQNGSTEAALAALDLVEALEEQMTVHRADSELLRINRRAVDTPVPVESRLFALFERAVRLHKETGGAFDITTGPLSEAWGFSQRQGRLPSEAEIAAALERVGMENVVLDAPNGTVTFRRPGVALHLNCIGKGYALDRMAELLDERGVGEHLLHGGRSSVLARGTCPGGNRAGWTIGIPDPLRPGERLAEIDLVDEALGTSGSGTQFFEHGGKRYGHLLDPRTGRPVEGIYSATVVAPTAAEADALSTAFYVMGPDKVADYCANRPEVLALLVTPTDVAHEVRLMAVNGDDMKLRITDDRSPQIWR